MLTTNFTDKPDILEVGKIVGFFFIILFKTEQNLKVIFWLSH